jgi:hypothetical protein
MLIGKHTSAILVQREELISDMVKVSRGEVN